MSDFVIENGVLTKYNGPGGDVVIPEGVTSIGDWAFEGCKSLTSVVIPEGVTSIGDSTFYWCSSLTSVMIPDTVKQIGSNAFNGCRGLADEEGYVVVKGILFDYFGENKKITIPSSVTSIGDGAFQNCGSLTSLVIPEGVTSIGNSAFWNCRSLTSVEIPEGVTSIGDSTFYWCSSLTSLVIPEGVTSIGNSAFWNCSSLTSVVIPDGVTSIGNHVFSECSSLESFELKNQNCFMEGLPFGEKLPMKLRNAAAVFDLVKNMSTDAVKDYILKPKVWKTFSPEQKYCTFQMHHEKELFNVYPSIVNQETAAYFGEKLKASFTGTLSAEDCLTVSAFLAIFRFFADTELLKELFEGLKKEENREQALETIMNEYGISDEFFNQMGSNNDRNREIMEDLGISAESVSSKIQELYGISLPDLSQVVFGDGMVCRPEIIAWLLCTHEKKDKDRYSYAGIETEQSTEIHRDAQEVIEQLSDESFQGALENLADRFLGLSGRSKEMYLAYPICRYAGNSLMEKLLKTAPKWKSSVSGNNAPPLRTFRRAVIVSECPGVMEFADKYGDLEEYALLRGITVQDVRDLAVKNIGLDENGKKFYDLGSVTLAACLTGDLKISLYDETNGKPVKSVPKKGNEEDKVKAAAEDIAVVKKQVKSLIKNRNDILFSDYLSGSGRAAASWKKAYLGSALLRIYAGLIVWQQEKESFTVKDGKLIRSDGSEYTLGEAEVKVAHNMELDADTVKEWQEYFRSNGLKQPFEQIWEPYIDPATITEDRYENCSFFFRRAQNADKHGIHFYDEDYHNYIYFTADGCEIENWLSGQRRHDYDKDSEFVLGKFKFEKYTRKVNHIVYLLDKWTILDRIPKNDMSILKILDGFNAAQISDFIARGQEAGATELTAELINYKHEKHPEYDAFEEFTLD